MALQKQAVSINFQKGLDTKTDPYQLQLGNFISLVNSVFDKIGRLTKRNGFGQLPSLPDATSKFATTFNDNLTAIGYDLKAYSPGLSSWVSKGPVAPMQLSTLPLIRNNTNQTWADTAVSPNGLICTIYTDNIPIASATLAVAKYAIADAITGQNIIAPTEVISSIGTVSPQGRVFVLGNHFVLVFSALNGATPHLQYQVINSFNPTSISSASDISASYRPSTIGSITAFDGAVANNSLFLSWNASSSSGVRAAYITSTLLLSSQVNISSASAFKSISVAADTSGVTPAIWTSFYDGSSLYSVATNQALSPIFSTSTVTSSASAQITNIAQLPIGGINTIYYERAGSYPYDSNIPTSRIDQRIVYQTGSVSAGSVLVRSLGLYSKGFFIGSSSYVLGSYQSPYQSTYFLIDSSGGQVAKLSYGNASGYAPFGLTSVSVSSSSATFGFLFKDQIQAVNKDTNVSAGTQVNGIYAQLGINSAKVVFGTNGLNTTEIGANLNLNGGFLWSYDGYSPVEQGFHLYPDSVEVTNPAVTGSVSNQVYFYQATYEWADNQGNLFRSAPSIPVSITVSSNNSVNVINVPTLRLTRKIANPVKVVIYRWSTAQQIYYQVTSINVPILNDTTVDSISFTDRNPDSAIIGNNILYTNGGVVENVGGPAATGMTLFDSRHWLIDAEDQNLLWYSKQVIETTPVEMSDLFTLFISPNAGAQGNTGPMKCLAPMDEKLIILKKNALYYINGSGPDNTGGNSQYSQPNFITSNVGSENPASLIVIPQGLMFQSDKGIWLLGRDLSTQYIGKEVEAYNSDKVLAAVAVPGTNQVRFTLASGAVLMYDYFMQQWGTFSGIPGLSSCLYKGLHTFINKYGNAYQETPGTYVDGSVPVVMSFTTGWINLAGLQGYKRVYCFYLLGTYKTPHTLTVGLAHDYDPAVTQSNTIVPDNYSSPWGSDPMWGDSPLWGGQTTREQWRVNFDQQQCQSFQVTLNEYYDATLGVSAGEGLTISGLNLVAGIKGSSPKNVPKINTVG